MEAPLPEVDKEGDTIDFLLRDTRDEAAALRFFAKANRANGDSEEVTIDKSGSNKTAMDEINLDVEVPILVWQNKYLNDIIEQDHRAVKRITKPKMGFKAFCAARNVLAGIELVQMIRKGPMIIANGVQIAFAGQFYALAA